MLYFRLEFDYRACKKYLAFSAIVALTNSLNLKCTFKTTSWIDYGDFYTCSNPTFSPDGVSNDALRVIGTHWDGYSNADVKGFNMHSDQLQMKTVPKGIGKLFPNIAAFQWYNGSLTSIKSVDLEFPDLQVLILSNNRITSLEPNLFEHTKKLKLINLINNSIGTVGKGILDGLRDLTRAFFQNNRCINFNAFMCEVEAAKVQLRDQCTKATQLSTTTSPPWVEEVAKCAEEVREYAERLQDLQERMHYLESLLEYCIAPVVLPLE